MRVRAPLVYEWVARMWAARPLPDGAFVFKVSDDLTPMLKEICETHLQQLASNAVAYGAGQSRFEMTVQGCQYKSMPVSRYRVYCLERLREHYQALDPANQDAIRSLLPFPEANILWDKDFNVSSGYDEARHLPYGHAINVYGEGTP